MACSRLSPLQQALLLGFFEHERAFFLTGGAALAGYYLCHRETKDLDLFAVPEADLGAAVRAVFATAAALGAQARLLRESADFRRVAVSRGDELTLVDLVLDRAPQAHPVKPVVGTIRLDPEPEIAANKLCAMLDRSEARDLIDLMLLLDRGLLLEQVLADAQKKHAGADPATLAWALSVAALPPSPPLAAGVSREALEAFRRQLVRRLTDLALPCEPDSGYAPSGREPADR
jgi:hypothetical protein